MLVAVISDIHSNPFALEAVLHDARRAGADEIWIGGDIFGYYPWAAETFELLDPGRHVSVLGNHDSWVLEPDRAPENIAGEIARHNAGELTSRDAAALSWLQSLRARSDFERNGWCCTLVHGTPDDQLDGRYYPDDRNAYAWLPGPGEILILGQTHYPLLRGDGESGLILNPGSVGQPRDGDPMPSWALLDLSDGRAELRRTQYDNREAIARLRGLGWDERIVLALDRTTG